MQRSNSPQKQAQGQSNQRRRPALRQDQYIAHHKKKLVEALEQHEKIVALQGSDKVLYHEVCKIWKRFDADGNGYLDREELALFVREVTSGIVPEEDLTEERLDKIFHELDKDGNGKIDPGEMLEFVK